MGLYNFQPRFVPFILSGKKTHTIRANREHPDKPGNTIHCYTGLRRKGAKLVGRFKCVKVEEIKIYMVEAEKALTMGRFETGEKICRVRIDGLNLSHDEKESLARRDGFKDFAEMLSFWREPKNRLPFTGQIIHWQRKPKEPKASPSCEDCDTEFKCHGLGSGCP